MQSAFARAHRLLAVVAASALPNPAGCPGRQTECKRASSFILDNKAVDRKGRSSQVVLERRRRNHVNEIESSTGPRFLTALLPADQKRLRATTNPMWLIFEGCQKPKKRED